jgi:hypothetical protein
MRNRSDLLQWLGQGTLTQLIVTTNVKFITTDMFGEIIFSSFSDVFFGVGIGMHFPPLFSNPSQICGNFLIKSDKIYFFSSLVGFVLKPRK